jgi:hypothetical protein
MKSIFACRSYGAEKADLLITGSKKVQNQQQGHDLVEMLRTLYSGEVSTEYTAPRLLSMLLLADQYERVSLLALIFSLLV